MSILKENKDAKIRKYYKPSEKDKKLIHHVYDRFYKMRDNPQRQTAVNEWDDGERAWDQYIHAKENLDDWQSDYFVPRTTSVVESVLSEMMDQSPRPIILPRSTEDIPKATLMEHVFNYTWEVADGDVELSNVFKDCLIYGIGFAQEYYWKERRMVKTLKNVKKNKKGQRVDDYDEKEVFEYDDCYMESVSPYELYFDETARTINSGPHKARDCVRRYVMKIADAKIMFSGDIWDPFNNARFIRPGSDTNWYSFYKPPEDIDKSDEVEVLWYWSRKPEDWLIIVANDVLIKAGPNPYKHKQLPFAMAIDVKRPHKFYHKGEPKLLESIQRELNTMRRMITDRNHLDIDKMWLVDRNETFSEDDTIARPHGFIRVDDPSNYKPIEYGDISRSVQFTLNEIDKDTTRVTGVDDTFQSSRSATTATEAAILKEATQQRIKMKLKHIEDGFLIDIGRMRVSNILQFYSQPKLEKIVGEAGTIRYKESIKRAMKIGTLSMINNEPYEKQFRDIRIKDKEVSFDERGQVIEKPIKGFSFFKLLPEYFLPIGKGGYDIRFEAGSTMPVSKPLMTKQTQDAVAMLMPLATAGIGYDPVKLGDDLLRSLDKDPDEFKIEPEQVDVASSREEMLINLAGQENEEVIKGNPIPEMGTPYATDSHSRVHIGFLRSEKAKTMPDAQYKLLVKHTMGEILAQESRGEISGLTGGGNMAGAQQPQAGSSASPFNEELKATVPGKVQGGEEVQGGQKGSMMTRVFGLLGRKR